MQKKVYPQSFKDEVVKFYSTNHTIAETIRKFGIAESTLFEWRKRYNEQHYLSTSTLPRLKHWRQKELHLSKIEQKLEVLGKCSCGVNASIDEKMAAIAVLEGQYSIHVLCESLNLSRGTYYNRKRKANNKTSYEKSDEEIKPLIEKIFYDSKERFGRKPIHHKLSELGYRVSEKRVARLMQEMGLEVKMPPFLAQHKKSIPRPIFKNLLGRQFDQMQPNLVWVSDITYAKVGETYYFICVIIDLFSRRLLSYGISDLIDTTLVMKTFDDAYNSRGKPSGLMFHSDQGTQYTSSVFRKRLREAHITQSFSTPCSPYDNSVCESFFHTLKKEAIYHHLYEGPQELDEVMREYFHFYNAERPHRKLNMKTPLEFETEFFKHA
ncbi:MAG: IS3 family transposase [Clostridia bacterium]|nr:IS3 family transposase [Clostridia bacterium]